VVILKKNERCGGNSVGEVLVLGVHCGRFAGHGCGLLGSSCSCLGRR